MEKTNQETKEPTVSEQPETKTEKAAPHSQPASKTAKSPKAEKPPKAEKAAKNGEAERQKLMAENEKLKKELQDAKDQYQRMLAEYANYKRRTEQEKEQIGAFTKMQVLQELLPSIDNMERAVDADEGDTYKKGVDMTMTAFRAALKKLGLEEIDADQAPFNPEIHNAVMREDADGVEPDTVTQVLQKGYKLGDKVLRPAMVKVAN